MSLDSQMVVQKIANILAQHDNLSNSFFQKWGITQTDFVSKIADPLTHGGLISKLESLSNLKVSHNTTVLDIGPEMGLEVFLLNELTQHLTVSDPDVDNTHLIQEICKYYVTSQNSLAIDQTTFINCGFNNNEDFISTESNRYRSIVSKLDHSLPTFYNVTSSSSFRSTAQKFDLIFVHKILTTLTRNNGESQPIFLDALSECLFISKQSGVLSWTEPTFVFEQKGIMQNGRFRLKHPYRSLKIATYQPKSLPEEYTQLIFSTDTI